MAGRDVEAGGTWMGAAPGGRWALVTNVRDPAAVADARAGRRAPRSRGEVPVGFLAGTDTPAAYAEAVHGEREQYGAFNLLVGVGTDVWFASAREAAPRALGPGVYGLSNATLDTPWSKLVRTRERLRALLASPTLRFATDDPTDDALLTALDDRAGAPDDELPETGVGLDVERVLAAPRIVTAGYGTRVSTVLRLAPDGTGRIAERTWRDDGTAGATRTVPVGAPADAGPAARR